MIWTGNPFHRIPLAVWRFGLIARHKSLFRRQSLRDRSICRHIHRLLSAEIRRMWISLKIRVCDLSVVIAAGNLPATSLPQVETCMTIAAKSSLVRSTITYFGQRPFCVNFGQTSPELLRLRHYCRFRNTRVSVYPFPVEKCKSSVAQRVKYDEVQHRPQLDNSTASISVRLVCVRKDVWSRRAGSVRVIDLRPLQTFT